MKPPSTPEFRFFKYTSVEKDAVSDVVKPKEKSKAIEYIKETGEPPFIDEELRETARFFLGK